MGTGTGKGVLIVMHELAYETDNQGYWTTRQRITGCEGVLVPI